MLKQDRPALPFFKNERFRAPTVSLAQNSAISYFRPSIKFRENPEIFLNGIIKDLKKDTPQGIIKREMETTTDDLPRVQEFRKILSVSSQSQSDYDGTASIESLSTQVSSVSVDPLVEDWIQNLQAPVVEKKQRISKSAEFRLSEQREKQFKAEEKAKQAEQAQRQLQSKLTKKETNELLSAIYTNFKQATGLQKVNRNIKKEVEGMIKAGYTLEQASSALLQKPELQKRIKAQAQQATVAKAEISALNEPKTEQRRRGFKEERVPEILDIKPKTSAGMSAQEATLTKKVEKLIKRVLNIESIDEENRLLIDLLISSGMSYEEIKLFIERGSM